MNKQDVKKGYVDGKNHNHIEHTISIMYTRIFFMNQASTPLAPKTPIKSQEHYRVF